MPSQKTFWAALLLCALVVAPIAFAQIRSGTVTGTVTDATGAVVAGAEVTITNQETNINDTARTTETGQFTVPYLPAGTYTVAVKMSGFSPYRQTGLALATAQTARVDVSLKVGAVEAAIEVKAEAAQIQTDSSTVQGAMQSEMIAGIPNIVQNPMHYAMLQAGVVPRNNAAQTSSINSFGIGVDGRRQWSAMGVNGGRAWTNDIQLDGLPVMGGGYNEASVVPNTEGLQEVRVIANNFTAQYGHGQSVVAMSTKSGTNDYHGQAVYRLRNESLNANSNSNNANAIARTAFKVNEMGGAIGGPIKRDKLFFFSSYHYLMHDRGTTALMTVPTALERKGDFSKTLVGSLPGSPALIFNPFSVTQLGPDLYQRTPIPNAIIPNPDQYALKMFGFYPDPNRTPDDAFNLNNFSATTIQAIRRHSLNNRIDYRRGNHSLYGSGGIMYATITTPRPFGKSPFNGAPGLTGDKNPYGQIGDIFVINPTTIVDVRYGFNRIQTKNFSGDKEGFSEYDGYGIPKNIQPLMLAQGPAPVVEPNYLTGGSGGGSNWANLTAGRFGHKREQQSNHNFVTSITKSRGSWTHKAGFEVRNLLSNYSDPEEATAELASQWFQVGGNFNFEYVTANGGVATQNTNLAQRGVNGAGMLLSTGLWWIRPGANVMPAFSQKYFALYSQNDWRASSKLTLNLGLRWDLQPGPTERYNRMSSIDLTKPTSFGTPGAIVFAGAGGYSRNLWDTTYDNWGPRLGAAYQWSPTWVLRGGMGITYLPSNTGYFSGPTDYGSATFSSGTMQTPYGSTPSGVPVRKFSDPGDLNIATGSNPAAPQLYGAAESRFSRFYKNGRVLQSNFFVEKKLSNAWFASVGYSGSHGNNLMNRSRPVASLQILPKSTLDTWRASYIASNGVTNPANVQVANPWQPATGALLPFTGSLGSRTIPQWWTLSPYPLMTAAGTSSSIATSDYHSLQFRVNHAFAGGFLLDAHYTWSKELDNTDTMEDNQGFNAGGTAGNLDITNWNNNRKIGFSDIPHRFVASFLYELPFGTGKSLEIANPVARAIASGWQTGGTLVAQDGMPFNINGAASNAAYGHPDRVSGVSVEVPEQFQRWYDGNTTITLPNGRIIKPAKNTFLKYYTGAFSGRTVTAPNGNQIQDVYWWGTVAPTLNEMRNPGRFNIDLSVRRTFKIREQVSLEFAADATNLLNNTQLNGSYSGALGNTQTAVNAARGLQPGMGDGDGFGFIGVGAFDPRQVVMNLKLRF